ncbi:MAG TPA: DUF5689 domain-containing protein [Bacteroidales bacterium]|nr:DUF5689 domain-containing protein [Bacteroidales bacterium]HPS16165.1 DUF5689 domain-containing protein [Bacteroidales bacterium]
MNKFKNIFTGILFLSAIVFLNSCKEDDFDIPPVNIPTVNFSANTTIPELLAMHTAGSLESIDTNIIIKGIVTANDETGNIYKAIYIEDDSAGIQIPINDTYLYSTYAVGQPVYVKCQGLALGEYGGNIQLGYIVGGVIGRIPVNEIANHLFLDSLPGNAPIPVNLTIPTILSSTSYYNRLVKIDNVFFPDSGQTFSLTTATTNHNIQDLNGNIVVMRTSNYATFASSLMPSGTGSVTGILSVYNGTRQLYIRDLNDLQGFNQ